MRGALFRIANLITLGRDEQEIVEDFRPTWARSSSTSVGATATSCTPGTTGLWRIMAHRSLAVVRQARLITAQETFDHLSNVRLGVGLGVLDPLDPGLLNRVLVRQQTAHLELAAGRPWPAGTSPPPGPLCCGKFLPHNEMPTCRRSIQRSSFASRRAKTYRRGPGPDGLRCRFPRLG